MAILVILVASIIFSNLLSKTYNKEMISLNDKINYTPVEKDKKELKGIEHASEPEEDYYHYRSEAHINTIIEDLTVPETEEAITISPSIAIVIDDLGYEINVAEKMMNLDFPVSLSILPFLQYSEYIAEEGYKMNKEIMLHIPMEAKNSSANPGPGAIKSNMSEEDIRQTVRNCFDSLPHISGMNNHMGSKITENEEIMQYILGEMKAIDSELFFVDSKTTQNSVACKIAREMEINSMERTVFLDNEDDMEYIKGQMEELKKMAYKKGKVIAIGHDRINTYYVLKRVVPEIIREGIKIVPVSVLFRDNL